MAAASPVMRLSHRHLASESATPQPSSNRRARATLPAYEQQVAELNPTAKRSVQALTSNSNLRRLNAHLEHAQHSLCDTAGGINDALGDAWARYEKGVRRKRGREGEGEGDDGEDEEARKRVEELERRVKEVTEKMEERMRQVVDMGVRTEALVDVLRKIGEEGEGLQSQRRNIGTRTRRQEGEECDENESQDEDHDERPEVSASQTFENMLMEKKRAWEALSLTQRYTTHNGYIDFYRVIHESKSRNEDNTTRPLPHASTWFSHMEEPPTQPEAGESSRRGNSKRKHARRQVDNDDDDDEDIEIGGERISLKCPLTLRTLKDPVTSTKCPHSFEREAIEGMIRRDGAYPNTRSDLPRKKHVRCPVCTMQISLDDLRPDPVLARRVRRANEQAAREDEDEGDEDGDDDNDDVMLETEARRKRRNVDVKQERARSPSRIPDTQFVAVSDGDEHDESELSAAEMEEDDDE